ncbi:MAG: hypothetical protein HY868_11685 [Chloroflexi bacterium]|nr:hypothetical protein [Chloroflexota bacterium]
MQNSNTLRRFSLTAFALALLVALVAGVLFVVVAQTPVQAPAQTRMTNAAAEQDTRMVMQELERERLDQLNAHSIAEQLRARNAAEQDMRMVMQELEREQFDQRYAKSFDAAAMSCLDPRVSCDR